MRTRALFFRMVPQAWNESGVSAGPWRPRGFPASVPPVTTLSAATGGDLRRDLSPSIASVGAGGLVVLVRTDLTPAYPTLTPR
jgi:hypothetical protein